MEEEGNQLTHLQMKKSSGEKWDEEPLRKGRTGGRLISKEFKDNIKANG